MFRKPFKVKSNVAIRGSERRKLREIVSRCFPHIPQEMVSKIIPNKEELNVAKISTHNEENVTCYLLNKKPIFFEYKEDLYPTVYQLWEIPDLLQFSFVTYPNVFDILAGGADLMLPGVIFPSGVVPEFEKGVVCAVTVAGNRSSHHLLLNIPPLIQKCVGVRGVRTMCNPGTAAAAVGVGITTCSSKDILYEGVQGKRVSITHLFRDHLWSMGDKSDVPFIESLTVSASPDKEEVLERTINVDEDEEEPNGQHDEIKHVSTLDDQTAAEEELNKDTYAVISKSPQEETDELLENCFYQALLNASKVELPILVSTFTSQFLYPVCPDGKKIDIKNSSYKKMSRFLSAMESEGLVAVKELSKGVESIVKITVDNERIRNYKSTKFFETMKKLKELELEAKASAGVAGKHTISIEELYAVSAKTSQFFQLFQLSKGSPLSSLEVRKYLTEYVKDRELVDSTNKKRVKLDPLLTDLLCEKGKYDDALTWDILFSRMLNAMNECHRVTLPGRKPELRKGKVRPVEVAIEQRMGNKKVTLVKNLEGYGIDVKEFAQSLQHAAASSTTMTNAPGNNKNNEQHVLVQGVQTKHIKTLLDNLNIPKKYVVGLDSSGKDKKKR